MNLLFCFALHVVTAYHCVSDFVRSKVMEEVLGGRLSCLCTKCPSPSTFTPAARLQAKVGVEKFLCARFICILCYQPHRYLNAQRKTWCRYQPYDVKHRELIKTHRSDLDQIFTQILIAQVDVNEFPAIS